MTSDNSLTFAVSEMSCASCVGRVEKALLAVPDVHSAHVNLASETVRVVVDDVFDAALIIAALDAAGYPAELRTYRFSIENMSCASCVGRVERALVASPGVVSAAVNLAKEEATVQVIGVSPDEIAKTVTLAGYPASLIVDTQSSAASDDRKAQEADHLKRMTLLAAVLTAPVFILEMGSHTFAAMHTWVMNSLGMTLSWSIQFFLTGTFWSQMGVPFCIAALPWYNTTSFKMEVKPFPNRPLAALI